MSRGKRIVQAIRGTARGGSEVRFRTGVVDSVQSGPPVTLTLKLGGDPVDGSAAHLVPGCIPLQSYTATAGDVVDVLVIDGVALRVLGTPHS